MCELGMALSLGGHSPVGLASRYRFCETGNNAYSGGHALCQDARLWCGEWLDRTAAPLLPWKVHILSVVASEVTAASSQQPVASPQPAVGPVTSPGCG